MEASTQAARNGYPLRELAYVSEPNRIVSFGPSQAALQESWPKLLAFLGRVGR